MIAAVQDQPITSDAALQKSCSACGGVFQCSASSHGCWCESVKLSAEVLGNLRARYAGCLCPRCLAAAAEPLAPA